MFSSIHISDVYAESDDTSRVYTIVIDRFLNKNEDNDSVDNKNSDYYLPYGGDLEGIENQLDYIKEMGFDTIQLSPVFEMDNSDILGYSVTDYTKIAERFGGEEKFKDFISKAHDKDLKVIVDLPTTATDEFTALDDPQMTPIMEEYIDLIDRQFIDFNNEENRQKYKELMTEFVNNFDIDGVSMYIVQNVDRTEVLPDDIKTYAVVLSEDVDATNFDYTAYDSKRKSIAEAFGGLDKDIPEYTNSEEILMADHFFSERFTSYSVKNNLFPGTRVKMLYPYLIAHDGPVFVTYGTEIAQNGDNFETIHPQMNLWTDKEVHEFMKTTTEVFNQHPNLLNRDTETIVNDHGLYTVLFKTDDVDFILEINNTSETQKLEITDEYVKDGKELSGLLLGERVQPHGNSLYPVIDRELTELFAVIESPGLNHWYLISSLLIFGGFAIFIFIVAKRSKRKENA